VAQRFGSSDESQSQRQANLRQVQGRPSARRGVRRVQQSTPQATPGIKKGQKGSELFFDWQLQPYRSAFQSKNNPDPVRVTELNRMPRLLGVDIPSDRPTVISLQYLYGVGQKTARELCHKAGVNPQVHARELGEDEVARLAALLDKDYVVEGQLRRQVAQNISRLRDIACYRGVRHRRGLPVRGQRTRTNARTRKGPKKTVAGKKGVKDLR
jgi:small subunit ribosomal protein S13